MRILIKTKGSPINLSRLTSVDALNFPPSLTTELEKIIFENRFLWEPFIVSFDTFDDFINFLKKTNYKGIPISETPEITIKSISVVDSKNLNETKTMLQKN